jgi:hypothetical protein
MTLRRRAERRPRAGVPPVRFVLTINLLKRSISPRRKLHSSMRLVWLAKIDLHKLEALFIGS